MWMNWLKDHQLPKGTARGNPITTEPFLMLTTLSLYIIIILGESRTSMFFLCEDIVVVLELLESFR